MERYEYFKNNTISDQMQLAVLLDRAPVCPVLVSAALPTEADTGNRFGRQVRLKKLYF